MENDSKKNKKAGITKNKSQNTGDQPQRKGWMDLLKN